MLFTIAGLPATSLEYRWLSTTNRLSTYLGFSVDDLYQMAEQIDCGNLYKSTHITVKGRRRHIEIPKAEALRAVLRRIRDILIPAEQSLSSAVHGFTRGRSAKSNAKQHVGATYLLRIDIKDFFQNVTLSAVASSFERLGMAVEVAELLSRLVTRHGHLPTGASTSPLVSNLVLNEVDGRLENLANRKGLVYTRYADDLHFSGNSNVVFEVEPAIVESLRVAGYEANNQKTRRLKYGQPMFVTGLAIGHPSEPRLPRRFKRQLRTDVYFSEKNGTDSQAEHEGLPAALFEPRLRGRILYARSIEPKFIDRLKRESPGIFRQLFTPSDLADVVKRQRSLETLANRVNAREPWTPPDYQACCRYF